MNAFSISIKYWPTHSLIYNIRYNDMRFVIVYRGRILNERQKVPITKGRSVSDLIVTLDWQHDHQGIKVDAAAFLLNDTGQCSGDESFLF